MTILEIKSFQSYLNNFKISVTSIMGISLKLRSLFTGLKMGLVRNCNSCAILPIKGLTVTPPLCDWLGVNITITT